ncbi:MAG: hypothetical protein JW709_05760 [Sedimentisphaerales bacterium]|nr:hypothetical protein [Sedimentisphaerales bacterium]
MVEHSGSYDYTNPDVQATSVDPISPERFDFDAFADYEAVRRQRCRNFWQACSGVAVYRRVRVREIFLDGCRDMRQSLKLQLGGLQKSLDYAADIPNFLEPWYGIGVGAGAFGVEYTWNKGQAPAYRPKFQSISEALAYEPRPIANTSIGKAILDTIDYFLEETGGRLPMSLTDVQSPLNVACGLVDINNLALEMLDHPDEVREFLLRIADLVGEFIKEQVRRIGLSLVWPGHGFASCRWFHGLGMSDDYALMFSPQQYQDIAVAAMKNMAAPFGGPVFHSCGNWGHLAPIVCNIEGLKMVDGAFGEQTDPSPNSPEVFANTFANTGVVLNARIVGGMDAVLRQVDQLLRPGMKLIVVTYCPDSEQQTHVYKKVHQYNQVVSENTT